jgi:hypothetical protein
VVYGRQLAAPNPDLMGPQHVVAGQDGRIVSEEVFQGLEDLAQVPRYATDRMHRKEKALPAATRCMSCTVHSSNRGSVAFMITAPLSALSTFPASGAGGSGTSTRGAR